MFPLFPRSVTCSAVYLLTHSLSRPALFSYNWIYLEQAYNREIPLFLFVLKVKLHSPLPAEMFHVKSLTGRIEQFCFEKQRAAER